MTHVSTLKGISCLCPSHVKAQDASSSNLRRQSEFLKGLASKLQGQRCAHISDIYHKAIVPMGRTREWKRPTFSLLTEVSYTQCEEWTKRKQNQETVSLPGSQSLTYVCTQNVWSKLRCQLATGNESSELCRVQAAEIAAWSFCCIHSVLQSSRNWWALR